MAKKKIIALKKGSFTTKAGKQFHVDDKILDEIVTATRKLSEEDFPITIGHPEGSAPAYGWINKNDVERDGDFLSLLAETDNFDKNFLQLLKEKKYKKVSLGLRSDNSIHHLAFLGAESPAVKGLPITQFSADEMKDLVEIELSEAELSKWWFRDLKSLFRNIKNLIIELKDADTANKTVPEFILEGLENPPMIIDKEAVNSFSENFNNEEEMEKIKELENQIKTLETENAELKSKLSTAKTELSEAKKKEKQLEYDAFLKSDEVKNKVSEANRKKLLSQLELADKADLVELSENANAKPTNLENAKEIIKSLPDAVEMSEFGKLGTPKKNEEVELGKRMAEAVNK